MTYIEWKDSYSVYNNFLDEQHRKMIDAVNQLHTAFMRGTRGVDLGHQLRELSALTRTHFQTEEIMMHATLYPGLEEHIAEHQQLKADFGRIVNELSHGERELSEDLFSFLGDWVAVHIAKGDSDFGKHLRQFTEENPDAELPAREADLSRFSTPDGGQR